MEYRERQRREMVYATPKDNKGHALCHLCGIKPGSQMHEIVNRAQTNSASMSFQKYLCSWLCPECHMVAFQRENEIALWDYNFHLYDQSMVLLAFNTLVAQLGFRPNVNFPEM